MRKLLTLNTDVCGTPSPTALKAQALFVVMSKSASEMDEYDAHVLYDYVKQELERGIELFITDKDLEVREGR